MVVFQKWDWDTSLPCEYYERFIGCTWIKLGCQPD
jgi:hypothetical protein